ncbi:putative zinc-binding protein [candidate division KSB1 bacterium]|nr:putative zinc-binding protein [candidate division KSB1 bacterium]
MHIDQKNKSVKPLIYSCSGCSNVAQLANHIAVSLDRGGEGEMSCIAGVGGGVRPLVKKAQSRRHIIAIDGCPLKCVAHCLNNVGVSPNQHIILTDYNLKKKFGADFTKGESDQMILKIRGLFPSEILG